MKKYKSILLILLVACLGCSDWLDVNPRTEMKEEELLSTEDGYKSALVGAYIQLASEKLYGKNMSFYFTEFLARMWIRPSSSGPEADYYLPAWNFTNKSVEPLIDEIWKAYYTCIAHLNEILKTIDQDEQLFSNNNYHLIKGEALGLRAFLHLELLRLFGPIPNPEADNKPAIPYVEELTKDPNKLLTLPYKEVVAKIIRDLDAAELELEKDPLIVSENSNLNDLSKKWDERPNDEWHFYRQVRFNYYAVKGVKARYYHWIGNTEKAAEYAKEVIDSKKFRLANDNDYADAPGRDYKASLVMLSEHLFGVNNPSHQTTVQAYFLETNPRLTQSERNISSAYENITGDIRNVANRYWEKKQGDYAWQIINYFLKYSDRTNVGSPNTIPVLRLAEMYLILVEDADPGVAAPYFRDYLIARNLPDTWNGDIHSPAALKERLEKEYRKEFWGEGQMFFFYKKHAYTAYTWPSRFTVPDPGYEIPKPQSQTVFD